MGDISNVNRKNFRIAAARKLKEKKHKGGGETSRSPGGHHLLLGRPSRLGGGKELGNGKWGDSLPILMKGKKKTLNRPQQTHARSLAHEILRVNLHFRRTKGTSFPDKPGMGRGGGGRGRKTASRKGRVFASGVQKQRDVNSVLNTMKSARKTRVGVSRWKVIRFKG